MPMTITEKILARHAGRDQVEPGELIQAKVDVGMANDITGPIAIKEFEASGAEKVFDPEKVVLVMDHFVPAKDILSATQIKLCRDFARKHRLPNFFDAGDMGIEHALLPEKGIVLPGDLAIGADSHTVTYGALGAFATGVGSTDLSAFMITGEVWLRVPETIKFVYRGRLNPWVEGKDLILHTISNIGVDGARYKAMEFTGEAIQTLPISGRFTMANMAIEAGGKNGIFPPDEITREYVEKRAKRDYTFHESDPGARYAEIREYDVTRLQPQVAFPHSPGNVRPIDAVGNIPIDQVIIGSCTNGRIEDLRSAAAVLKGRKKSPYMRLIVIPATQTVFREALQEKLIDVFLEAGGVVSTPTCGPCLGGYMGVLAKGERTVATTNRNFVGRMGHVESEIYLTNPAGAAASAVLGRIASPAEVP